MVYIYRRAAVVGQPVRRRQALSIPHSCLHGYAHVSEFWFFVFIFASKQAILYCNEYPVKITRRGDPPLK